MQENKVLPLEINGYKLPMHSVYLFENVKTYSEEPSRSLDFSVAFTPKAFIPLVTVTWAMMKIKDYEDLISRIAPDEITLGYSDTEDGKFKYGKFYAQRPTVERNIALEGDFMYVRNVKVVFASTMSEPEETFTITYDANGGTPTIQTQEVFAWNEFTVASANENDISRTNYIFQKWNTQPDGSGSDFAPDSNRVATADITLYAIWEEYFQVSEGLEYTYSVNNDGYFVSGIGNADPENIVIPPYYNDGTNGRKEVKGITYLANSSIKKISIPETVTSFEYRSLLGNNIDMVNLPNRANITTESFKDNQIKRLVLKNNNTLIGPSQFENNSIENLTIENGVFQITPSAFRNNNITDLLIPNSVLTVQPLAFEGNNIQTLKIGEFTKLRGGSFANNNMRGSITIKDTNSLSYSGFDTELGVFENNNIESVHFDIRNSTPVYDNVFLIGSRAFANNQINKISFSVPESIYYSVRIGPSATFANNYIHGEIVFPQGTRFDPGSPTIGAFENNQISKITYKSYISIPSRAFAGNPNLKEIVLDHPNNIPSWSENPRYGLSTVQPDSFDEGAEPITVKVPSDLVELYQTDTNWNHPMFNIVAL